MINIDTLGNILWVKKNGASDIRNGCSLCHASNGYIVAGYRTIGASFYGYIVKTDINGNALWSIAPGNLNAALTMVKKVKDGNFITCGYKAFYNNGSEDFNLCYVIKFSESGTIIWEKKYANPSPTSALNSGIELEDSSLVFIGIQ